jgi:hypothetical protein
MEKNGQIHVSIEFRDLKMLDLNNHIQLSIIKIIVDATIRHDTISFMDIILVITKIQMASKNEEIITFQTSKELYSYKALPFNLKNTSVTL